MAEQTINFQNGQRHPHKFRVSGLNSISRQIPMETSLDEVPGAEWHGIGGQEDQRAGKTASQCSVEAEYVEVQYEVQACGRTSAALGSSRPAAT